MDALTHHASRWRREMSREEKDAHQREAERLYRLGTSQDRCPDCGRYLSATGHAPLCPRELENQIERMNRALGR